MGKYYALAQGEDPRVAAAIEEHYKPAGPNDRVPTDPVSIAVALADKIDTLVGFWAIDEKPTGSKDPYALRRAALGVIRIVARQRRSSDKLRPLARRITSTKRIPQKSPRASRDRRSARLLRRPPQGPTARAGRAPRSGRCGAGAAGRGQDDLLLIVRRVEALGKFLGTDDGKSLLAGYKRADQHPAHRGEEGRHDLSRQAGPASLSAARGARSSPPRSMP